MNISRMKLAYILSPIVPSILFGIMFNLSELKLIIFMLMFSIPFSYVSCLLFGIPIVSFFKKNGCLNIINLVISGAVLGALVFYIFGFVFAALLGSSKDVMPIFLELLWGAVLGISVALPFSFIAGFPVWKVKRRKN